MWNKLRLPMLRLLIEHKMSTKDWIYDLYVKERIKNKNQVSSSINPIETKPLSQTNKHGKSKSNC